MRAAALLTPLLALGLLAVMARLEVWAQTPTAAPAPPQRRNRVMTAPPTDRREAAPEVPLLRDPPPPPGYVEPLAGSSAEDTYGHAPGPAEPDATSSDKSTANSREQF